MTPIVTLLSESRYSSSVVFKVYVNRANKNFVRAFRVTEKNVDKVRELWRLSTAKPGDYVLKAEDSPHVVIGEIDFEARYRRPR